MRLIDLSQPVFHYAPNCPAHPLPKSEVTVSHAIAGWQWETLTLASHTGSHLDAPLHKIAGGKSIDQMPLEGFVGSAYIADLHSIEPQGAITPEKLQNALPKDLPPDSIVLIATGWGEIRERTSMWLYQSPRLTPEAAEWLISKQIRGLGVDHWGIGSWNPENDAAVHTLLLGKEIWIVEELRLPPEVCALPMPQTFMALPIHLKGHSGAWCRPILILKDAP